MKISYFKHQTINSAPVPSNSLLDRVAKVFIIANKEPTEQLEAALQKEGFDYQILRQEPLPNLEQYSRSYLCLMNHRRAWEEAQNQTKLTLIIEADFVPVTCMGQLPLPFNPEHSDVGVSWIYTCASQVYSIDCEGYAQGFSVSTVAYIVTPQAATYLLELATEIKQKYGTDQYSSWDSTIDKFLRQRNLKNYIPWRNYGEHGGIPNPEHRQNNLSSSHRADVLYGKLAFMPIYALDKNQGKLELMKVRLKARLKGIARLLSARFLRIKVIQGSNVPGRLIRFAVFRQLSWLL
ncbi:hypothetical protein [Mastigocoleus testarum]|uniref:LPS biosynthesis glycosyltransferase n=1 Tax=Mastigocoleus testarum BC008 TaxID=371196 RepID=A0A0V7ZLG7_9CYAN|nr:hypothetical protein [Mastigocoleus testarum]KST62781.1 LPS biosynthesis glycosyltransferase [Mastigocoleus testarum BC008]KST65126.1 LPS biosynthesis glycosyltransferase [Mastigocoleus testarum BC008]